jgi:uncharacterized protein
VNASQLTSLLDPLPARTAFVAAMCQPAAYAALQAGTGPVRCIETHVSWVFLAGDCAYKVKKPLRLAFLDYSSAARREALCREELRLNRRHAPDLYLDVVPIAGTPAAPRVGAIDGPAFEHALRMRRFDPALELTRLLQQRTVAAAEVAALGTRLARMHAAAAVADASAEFGTAATAQRVMRENFRELAVLLPQDARRLQDLQQRLEQWFERDRPAIERRRHGGRVREGHGDLHCGNVVRWQGELVPFDGLEFDPALRWIDVANDLAFLSMDLAAHGRDDLRRELLQAWLTESGDFDALAVLPCYEACRALVRAKVALLRGQQAPELAPDALSAAGLYLDWAQARSARPPPHLVLLAGLSGSGKTTLAARAAELLGAVVVRSDVERKRLAGLRPLQSSASPPDDGIYTREFNAATYARLRECVDACLQGGESVVVDAANLRRDERAAFCAIGRRHGAQLRILHCTAPIDELRRRVGARAAAGSDASEATAALLDRQPSYWEPFDAAETPLVIALDTTAAGAAGRALDTLARAGEPTG